MLCSSIGRRERSVIDVPPAQRQRLANASAAATGCEGEVTNTRHDGSVLSVPSANVFELRGDKIAAYRGYIDNSSLFNKPA